MATQAEELALELDHVNALKGLLKGCRGLKRLVLGGRFSRQLTDRDMARALGEGKLAFPAMEELEVVGQGGLTRATMDLVLRCMPNLRCLRATHCPRLPSWSREGGEEQPVGGDVGGGAAAAAVEASSSGEDEWEP
jgi:hypothetical protein